jgi:glucuronate isomerase
MPSTMNSRPLMVLRLETAATEDIGSTRNGKLSIFPVIGGSFEGDRLRGKVLAGGGDWVAAKPDGTFELDLRVTLETDDGALIHMTFTGLRDDANQYFCTLPRFETAAAKYAFLNRLLAVGIGEIRPDGPVHTIEEIL